jgi:hypothetical protein
MPRLASAALYNRPIAPPAVQPLRTPSAARLAFLAALLFSFAALLLPAGARAATNPFAGLVSEDAFYGTPAYRASVLDRVARAGAGTMRQTLDWALIEPVRGRRDWSRFDAWVGATARANIQVLPVVFNPPAWASKRPRKRAKRGTYPPKRNSQFAAFAADAARRYGPNGTFWAANPGIPPHPITSWQIWNEPNLPVYWQPKPRASKYVALLRATSRAIKQVNPEARILTAGLPKSKIRGSIPLATFVRQIYAVHGADAFDALAVNPYSRTAKGVVAFLKSMRSTMDARGDSTGDLWATEIGWSDNGPGAKFRLGSKGQARAIQASLTTLWAAREALRLQGVIYFNWRDAKPYPGGRDFWGLHTGLVRRNGTAKPALRAFADAVANLR